jgi:hypothetical protein
LYRRRLVALRDQLGLRARVEFDRLVRLEDLDGTHAAWVARLDAAAQAAQAAAGRLSIAYLAGFVSAELGRRIPPALIPVTTGSAAGKPVADALADTLVTVRVGLADGLGFPDAAARAATRASRLSGELVMHAARGTLATAMQADPRVTGWRRVTSGGCGACLAAASDAVHAADDFIDVHDGCRCSSEPVVRGVPDRVQRPTGQQIFERLSRDQQDALLGEQKARLIRSGDVSFHRLIDTSPMVAQPDVLTERPLKDM